MATQEQPGGVGGAAAIGPGLAETARAADRAGFTTLTLMDHWFQMEHMAPADDPTLEGYTALGFLAGQTEHLRPRPSLRSTCCRAVARCSGSAPPGTSLRTSVGVPFPPVAERFERPEEALRVCRQM